MPDASEPKLVVTPKSKQAFLNESVVLECAASGHPEPQITWLKDRKLLNLGYVIYIKVYMSF